MDGPLIIAVETSGREGSVALARGGALLGGRSFSTRMQHARDLLPALDELYRGQGLSPGEADHCYVSIGPGSFTGLRVAVAFARHLALARGVKLVAVPTLAVIARRCRNMADAPKRLAVMLDAKRGRVFGAVFTLEDGGYVPRTEPAEVDPVELLKSQGGDIAVAGEGAHFHRKEILDTGARLIEAEWGTPTAACVHELGWEWARQGRFTAPRDLVPLYVRRPEAEEVWERRQSAAGTN